MVYEVADPLQLPFAAQCMVEKKGVAAVVVIGFLVAESHWCCKEVWQWLGPTADNWSHQVSARVSLNYIQACLRSFYK